MQMKECQKPCGGGDRRRLLLSPGCEQMRYGIQGVGRIRSQEPMRWELGQGREQEGRE